MKTNIFPPKRLEALVSASVAALLLFYVFVRFFGVPYVGFHFTGTSGEIVSIYEVHPESDPVQLGDELLVVGGADWEEYSVSLRDRLFMDQDPGEVVEISVLRDGREIDIDWVLTGFNIPEFMGRLLGVWIVSFVFWAAGAATLLFVRPRTNQRTLLAALNFVTAIWLFAGALSRTHAWESPYVMRTALWMSAPIYLQFHWVFPRPIRELPRWLWAALYGLFGLGALAQWFSLLPLVFYAWPFSVGILGSLLILLVRFFFRGERRQVGLLFLAMLLAFSPTVLLAFSASYGMANIALVGSLFALPVLPVAYFYSIYRRQLGGLELRANRLISTYLFLAILLILTLAFLPLASRGLETVDTAAGSVVAALVIGVLATAFGLRSFQHFVERRILSMPIPPEHLLGEFASRISTSLTEDHLAAVLEKQILPSLFIREAALLFYPEQGDGELIVSHGLSKQLVADLLAQPPQVLQTDAGIQHLDEIAWVRLTLPLSVSDGLVGLLVLGRKDPDDYYSQAEVDTLRAIADQTAIALVNITQAKRLRALHQADIDREETERRDLARELHDQVLNRLGELGNRLGEAEYTAEIESELRGLSTELRNTVNNLRPPMLNLGLHAALMQLADDLGERPDAPQISLKVLPTTAMYPPNVEQHLFRVVQQACENALRHAQAGQLVISGELAPGAISLTVRDDGRGFDAETGVDLLDLLQARHFGLAGMYERAELIGAKLSIYSARGKGAEITIEWRAT